MGDDMDRKWILGLTLAAVLSLFVAGSALAAGESPGEAPAAESAAGAEAATPDGVLDETCESGYICVWTSNEYKGVKGMTLCSNGGSHPLGGEKYSIKNRCANRKVSLDYGPCLNPGTQSPNTFDFKEIIVGAEGSRC
jgi:hypothetical protein